jgi:hypothetical protein
VDTRQSPVRRHTLLSEVDRSFIPVTSIRLTCAFAFRASFDTYSVHANASLNERLIIITRPRSPLRNGDYVSEGATRGGGERLPQFAEVGRSLTAGSMACRLPRSPGRCLLPERSPQPQDCSSSLRCRSRTADAAAIVSRDGASQVRARRHPYRKTAGAQRDQDSRFLGLLVAFFLLLRGRNE